MTAPTPAGVAKPVSRRRFLGTSAAAVGVLLPGSSSIVSACSASSKPNGNGHGTVLVYGGTAAGVAAAVAAAREGMRVLFLLGESPLGGMVTNGLSRSDVENKKFVGGFARKFFVGVGAQYGSTEAVYDFEPKIATKVMQALLSQYSVVARPGVLGAVTRDGATVRSVRTTTGVEYEADVFIDASYEGTLLRAAELPTVFGRESRSQYGESFAGYGLAPVSFEVGTSMSSQPLQPRPSTAVGAADQKTMAYNYRLCLSDDPANSRPFPRPAGYQRSRYQLLLDSLHAGVSFNPRLGPLPNHKFDLNSNGFFSTDLIGGSWAYPTADQAGRAAIAQTHLDYLTGLLYFVTTDPAVPAAARSKLAGYGLAADEFTGSANLPTQLYVRECVRMVGAYVMRQADMREDRTKPDSIGVGTYPFDSHYVQWFATGGGRVELEGGFSNSDRHNQPYEIPYRVLTPRATDATNVLAPVCVSASHVAYSSLRIEAVYMNLGEAAGVAAALASASGRGVQQIDVSALQTKLTGYGAKLQV